MTTTTLTARKGAMHPKTHRRFFRDTVGWNRRATLYWAAVGIACLLIERVHP